MKKILTAAILSFVIIFGGLATAPAATLTVTKTADTDDFACNADCSLREAIQISADGDTIEFNPAVFGTPQIITLSHGFLFVNRRVTINGPGANLLTVNGNNASQVFYITSSSNVIVRGLTITGGRTTNDDGGGIFSSAHHLTLENLVVTGNQVANGEKSGGGIYSYGSMLIINNSTFSGNFAPRGAGLSLGGHTTRINNSTISGNTATGDAGDFTGGGAGIFTYSTAVYLANSTLSGNAAPNGDGGAIKAGGGLQLTASNLTIANNTALRGGGIYHLYSSGYFGLRNTIIAGNTGIVADPDLSGDFNIGIYNNNLVGNRGAANGFSGNNNQIGTGTAPINAGLAPLGNYGGATQTHALLGNSPALNAGSDCVLSANSCGNANPELTNDQRGTNAPRKIGVAVDIGAFERNIVFDQTTLPNGNETIVYSQQLSVSRPGNFAEDSAMSETIVLSVSQSNPDAFQLAPFTFSTIPVAGQQLPPGLTLSSGGILSGTPTQIGTFTFTVRGTDADGMAGVQQFTVQIFGPTAAGVSISGRILTPNGRGLTGATVSLTDAAGNTRTTRTSTFGYYRFDKVEAGRTYVMTVRSKRYRFAPHIISVTEDVAGLNFTAN